jgi:hypothetical protein
MISNPSAYMNHVGVGKRKYLSNKQREWLVDLVRKTSSESNKRYLRSILADGKVPTQLQKNIILNISKLNSN